MFFLKKIVLILCSAMLISCTSVTIDETQFKSSELNTGETVVVLGRRNSGEYETEPELISCVDKEIAKGENGIKVIPEHEFVDKFYPWFEARTAPVHVRDLQRLLSYKKVADQFDSYKIHYIIWIDGNTETIRSSGGISCAVSVGFAGCFGFGTWDKKAEYEATIWNYKTKQLIGKVSSQADGTSYMPAVIIPIPIIAPVQTDACKAMAEQLKGFFQANKS